ncbi:inactive pancreatic lipase-related protein 1-like [Sitodiplosis mosellana]|uniref:inactive pancreatic lipase-related protein 1-like n=1 Tax=Sitodiplosis mosellana TaxID=263140 RepID=UPI00244512A7|nr:inactive pancreatic lipase-related protein 1-like [Sitodiplosis mosellana]
MMHSSATAFLFCVCILMFDDCTSSFDADEDVIFKLYKRDNPTNFTVLRIDNQRSISNDTLFDPELPTKIHIHGYLAKEEIIDRYRQVYLSVGDYNFIVVDWLEGAFTLNYFMAKRRVKDVGGRLAELIEALVKYGMSLKDLTLVGHSLGAHVAGCSAKMLNSTEKIGIIIGLDPASVGFDFAEKDKRLAETDADYVQVIHTDITKFGMAKPMGHADIYPNSGKLQPGCKKRNILTTLFDKCSHHRSHELFWETLTATFIAIKCASYDEITQNRCTFNNVTTIMGGDIISNTTRPNGTFYLETSKSSPFVVPDYKSFKNIEIIYQLIDD